MVSVEKIFVCTQSEISPDAPVVFRLPDGKEAVLFRTSKGYFAVGNRCPHAGARLHDGGVKGNVLICNWHGWRFDLETGQCLTEYWARLKTFPVLVEQEKVYIQYQREL